MRMASLAKMMVGVEDVVVEGVEFDDERQAVVIDARPYKPQGCRCGRCGRKATRYDDGRGRAPLEVPTCEESRSVVPFVRQARWPREETKWARI